MKGSKILATIVAIAMVMSTIVVLSDVSEATRNITTENNYNAVVLSNDGSGNQWDKLTCGELITLYVNNNSLIPGEDYGVKVWNGSTWRRCYDVSSTDEADEYGDLAIQFHVPGWNELQHNPILDNGTMLDDYNGNNLTAGQWNVSLFTEDVGGTQLWSGLNITINIGNCYDVFFTLNQSQGINNAIDKILWGKQHTFWAHVRNWTGANGWENDYDETDGVGNWDISVKDPNWASVSGFPVDKVGGNQQKIVVNAWLSDKEYYYWVKVSNDATPTLLSNVTLPVKLDFEATIPSNIEWGDSFTIDGSVNNASAGGSGINGYEIAVFAPTASGNNGGWTQYSSTTTALADGSFAININTGPDKGYCAGTWYLGTYDTSPGEIDEADMPPYIDDFIPYYSFTVGTEDDKLNVKVENTDDIITGFTQTINVSIKNESFMEGSTTDSIDEFKNMHIHVTGLAGWDGTTEYDDDDIVELTPWKAVWTDANEKYCYYEVNYTFNETGTATFLASWPGNQTSHTIDSPNKLPGNDSSYSNTYNESTSLLANITGTATTSVVSADSMNLIINNMASAVSINKNPGTCSGSTRWLNSSSSFLLQVYGSTSSDPMNATIKVSGCGLDFTIKETDTVAGNDYLTSKPGVGQYNVQISPKTGGTLKITASNGTNSVSKDYTISGLTGTVTTSEGDDKKITVGSTEKITVDASSDFATVYVTFFDADWTKTNADTISLNDTIGDGTTVGEGKDGEYTFIPDEDSISEVGYIVVALEAGSGNYMYDIIEVVPVYDLEIDLISPINDTEMLTVGLEYDELQFKIVDGDGNVVTTDSPSATLKLIDETHNENDPLQTWTATESGDNVWEVTNMRCYHDGQLVITGENASTGIKHEGNLSIDVGHATITYSPTSATAGIGTKDLTVTVKGIDANGDPLPKDTDLYFWVKDYASEDTAVGGVADNTNAVNFKNADTSIKLDENGEGEFELDEVGDNKTSINATLVDGDPADGNRTLGKFNINFPQFELSTSTIYIGQSNEITITAKDASGDPIKGINLTLWGATLNGTGNQPDPVKTDANGVAIFSITPDSSGIINVTIARNVRYVNGILTWDNTIITDTSITITAIKSFQITVSKSPITEGETLTVTVTDGTNPVTSANVEFAGTTQSTDSSGKATFTAPDPIVESVTYYVTVTKAGFTTKDKGVTVVKKYELSIAGPTGDVETGKSFTVTVIAKGSALAGATVTFEGTTVTSDGEGKATFKAPDTKGTYTVTASHDDYSADATLNIAVKKATGGTPGFEILTLIAAIGVAFILLRRRRNK
jgi:hypothetical protein